MKKTKDNEEFETRMCPCCGASLRLNNHRLNKGLVQILIKFRTRVIATRQNKVTPSDLKLNNVEYSNFQKLRYWGLIAKFRKSDGKHERGYWLLTRRGNLFCKGMCHVNEKVGTFRNKIRKKSDLMVNLGMVLQPNELPYWDHVDDIEFEFVDIIEVDEELWDTNGQGILNFKN